jgi:hypothetical protein
MMGAADVPAPDNRAELGASSAQPGPETIYIINADPRSEPMPLTVFPNPPRRPEGIGPVLVLDIFSEVAKGVDVAMGRAPKRDPKPYVSVGIALLRRISNRRRSDQMASRFWVGGTVRVARGAWKITTGASVSVIGVGRFT